MGSLCSSLTTSYYSNYIRTTTLDKIHLYRLHKDPYCVFLYKHATKEEFGYVPIGTEHRWISDFYNKTALLEIFNLPTLSV